MEGSQHQVNGQDVIGPPMSDAFGPVAALLPGTIFVFANTFEPGDKPTSYLSASFLFVAAVLIVAFAASIPRRVRFRRVQQRESNVIVLSIRSNKTVAEFLGSRHFASGFRTLALAISSDGISVWVGVRDPSLVARIPRADVRKVRAISMKQHFQRMSGIAVELADRELQFSLLGQRVPLSWPLGGESCATQAELVRDRLNGGQVEGPECRPNESGVLRGGEDG